ncbi:MAG: GNAT family N-acetyltransferase [Oscillospiraceae bacterium]
MDYLIRPIKSNEIPLLADFLYEAIFQRDENNPIPRSVIEQPEIKVFIKDFGKRDDNCLVAVVDDKIVGAVWTRILSGAVRGFGNVDEHTPEFAISLYRQYRGKGIGTRLMRDMLALLKEKGYAQTSLAVQKDNYAVKMYENVGFTIVGENEEEYIMVCKL